MEDEIEIDFIGATEIPFHLLRFTDEINNIDGGEVKLFILKDASFIPVSVVCAGCKFPCFSNSRFFG